MISNIESGDNEIDNLVARIDKLKKNKATEVEEINFLLTCPEVKPSGDHIKGKPKQYMCDSCAYMSHCTIYSIIMIFNHSD